MRHVVLPALAPALLGGLLCCVAARAENSVTEDLFIGDLPQVLSATRLRQPLAETPASVTILDRETIEAAGTHNIPDLLRLVPGFQVGHDGGNWTTVTYHGLSDKYSRRMQVLIDGRSVYTPSFGGVVWTDLPLMVEDIERIEVIRGPNGVAYGANSFSSVINIVTRAPELDAGTSLKYQQGDLDTRRGFTRFDAGDNDWRYRVSVGHQEDTGVAQERIANGQRTTMLGFRGDWRIDSQDSLDVHLGYVGGPRDDGETGKQSDPARERQMDSNYQQLLWRRALGDDDELRVNVYHTYHNSFDTYDATFVLGPPTLPITVPVTTGIVEDLRTERYNVELQHTLRLTPDARLVWGAEARRDEVTGAGWFATREPIESDLWRLFANAEWRIAPEWIANAGAMYERSDTVDGGDVSPRFALNHRLTPNHTLRAVYSRAYRTPSAFERAADANLCATVMGISACLPLAEGNPDLSPERIDSTEIGYLGTLFDRRLTVDLKFYRERIRNAIAWVTDGSAIVFRNDGMADIDGWETQIDWRPLRDTRLLLTHAYAHQRGRFLKNLAPPTYADSYRSTPVHTSSAMLMQKLPFGLEASLAYYRVSNMRWLDQGDDDDTDGFNSVDARLAYKLRRGRTRGTLALVGQNLTDDYFDYRNAWAFDKRFFLSLGLELH